MYFFILLGLALAPGLAIILFIYWNDTHEKEPLRLLLLSFFFGILSVFVTLSISSVFTFLFDSLQEHSIAHQAFKAFILVALVEEFSKYIFVKGILFKKPDFNEPYDGIVYTVMVGMGFATLENVLYVFQGGIEVGLWRMFTAVPAHASFAILMGFYLGKAKFSSSNKPYALFGLLAAVIFHGAYDFFLFINYIPGIGLGAILALVVAIVLSRKAIKAHQASSPFK